MHQQPPPMASRPRPRAGPPPADSRRPTRIEPLPDTPYGLAIYGAPPATAGPAVGSLVAGIAGILVSFIVVCLGFADAAGTAGGQQGGWGLLVGGAFGVLAAFLGAVGVGLGVAAIRQTRSGNHPAGEPVRGRGMGIAGLACGGATLLVTVCALGVAAAAAFA